MLYPTLQHMRVAHCTASLLYQGITMNTATCKALCTQSWKDLYQAAMCESNVNKLPERIADAETALIMRARELFYTSGDRFEEEESLDDAMCVLNALRSSLKRRPSAIHSTSGSDSSRSA
jgi:hypothetical protein